MDNIILISLSGKAQSGKDTVAQILIDTCQAERYAYADSLKEIAKALFFWDGSKELTGQEDTGRKLLINIGNKMREIRPTVWADWVMKQMEQDSKTAFDGTIYIITDNRYHNEADLIKQAGGYVVRVERPVGALNLQHVSETEMDDYPFDYTIVNDGTLEDLKIKTMKLIREIQDKYVKENHDEE